MLTSIELATQESPVYLGVSSASAKHWSYQLSPGPCGNAVCPGFWECSCTWFCISFCQSPRSSTVFMLNSWAWNTTLEDSINLDLTLFRLGVLISHRKPSPSPSNHHSYRALERHKAFLWLPRAGGGLTYSFLLLIGRGLIFWTHEEVKTPASTPPADGQYSPLSKGKTFCFSLVDHIAGGWISHHK